MFRLSCFSRLRRPGPFGPPLGGALRADTRLRRPPRRGGRGASPPRRSRRRPPRGSRARVKPCLVILNLSIIFLIKPCCYGSRLSREGSCKFLDDHRRKLLPLYRLIKFWLTMSIDSLVEVIIKDQLSLFNLSPGPFGPPLGGYAPRLRRPRRGAEGGARLRGAPPEPGGLRGGPPGPPPVLRRPPGPSGGPMAGATPPQVGLRSVPPRRSCGAPSGEVEARARRAPAGASPPWGGYAPAIGPPRGPRA